MSGTSKFKVGDRIRVLEDEANCADVKKGDEFVVGRVDGTDIQVVPGDAGIDWEFDFEFIELVNPVAPSGREVGARWVTYSGYEGTILFSNDNGILVEFEYDEEPLWWSNSDIEGGYVSPIEEKKGPKKFECYVQLDKTGFNSSCGNREAPEAYCFGDDDNIAAILKITWTEDGDYEIEKVELD